jgi:hypothetical protein
MIHKESEPMPQHKMIGSAFSFLLAHDRDVDAYTNVRVSAEGHLTLAVVRRPWYAAGKSLKEVKGMHPVPPPSPWKAIFLPGLLLGVLLALLQIALLSGLSAFGLLQLSDSLYLLLFYLVMPALFAFLVKVRTGQPATGNRVGRCAGITCAILLFGATIVFLAYIQANPQPTPNAPGLMAGALREAALSFFVTTSLFINAVGALLAIIGAFLGSTPGSVIDR